MKSDDAKRVAMLRDLLMAYDPSSDLEPGMMGEDGELGRMSPLLDYGDVQPSGLQWPGSMLDMMQRAPDPRKLGPRNLYLSQLLNEGQE